MRVYFGLIFSLLLCASKSNLFQVEYDITDVLILLSHNVFYFAKELNIEHCDKMTRKIKHKIPKCMSKLNAVARNNACKSILFVKQ